MTLPSSKEVFFIFQEIVKKYGKMVIIPASILLILFIIFLQKDDESQISSTELITTIPEEQLDEQENELDEPIITMIMVDVKGAVKFPGVYQLTTDDRIIDAVQKAGGYLDGAQTDFINHAQKLEDEMVIYIPHKGEQLDQLEAIGQAVQLPASTTSSTKQSKSNKVNINSADESTLTTLPGIGPSKAQAILSYREENGSFNSIEDLKNVSGIGEKTFERLKELIDVK